MNLNYKLPQWTEEILPPEDQEERYYAIPYDIGADGAWLSDSYLVIPRLVKISSCLVSITLASSASI